MRVRPSEGPALSAALRSDDAPTSALDDDRGRLARAGGGRPDRDVVAKVSGTIVWVAALEAVSFIASVTKVRTSATAARTPAITVPRRSALPVTLVLSAGNACAQPQRVGNIHGPVARPWRHALSLLLTGSAGRDGCARIGLLVDRVADGRVDAVRGRVRRLDADVLDACVIRGLQRCRGRTAVAGGVVGGVRPRAPGSMRGRWPCGRVVAILELEVDGIAMASRIPMMMMTTRTSMSVKPSFAWSRYNGVRRGSPSLPRPLCAVAVERVDVGWHREPAGECVILELGELPCSCPMCTCDAKGAVPHPSRSGAVFVLRHVRGQSVERAGLL